ncbi:MAG: glycosyl hydrolase [Coriobacteriia bacterium]
MRRPHRILACCAIAALAVGAFPGAPAAASTRYVSAASPLTSFSPDRDGYRDTLPISYRLTASARVTVRVYRGATLVRTLRSGLSQPAGRYAIRWDGRTATSSPAPRGYYRWIVTAARGIERQSSSAPVTLTRVALPTDRWVGYFVQDAPRTIQPLATLESITGVDASVVNYFQTTAQGFDAVAAANAAGTGAVGMATLEFWDPARGVDQPGYSLHAIVSGAWDAYLRRYAADAKAFGRTVWLRPLHEMNGNWYPWAGTVNGNSPEEYVAAWRHVRDIFRAEGADNVRFVWAPSSDSVPAVPENAIARYWPGDAYVDYIAFDGYNFGSSASWSTWRSFADTFGRAYAEVTPLTAKPMFIAETASSTDGGDKAAWIADMFRVIPQRFPRIQGVCWFNVAKEADWRVESSPGTLASFSLGAASF